MTMPLENRCDDCNLQFTSKAILTDHLAGKRHKKKVETLKISDQNADLSGTKPVCNVCGVSMNSLLQYQAHLKGTKHLSNTDKNGSNQIKSLVTKTETLPIKKDGTSTTSTSEKSLKPTKNHKESFTCDSCQITTNSKCQYDIHMMSQKHKAKEQGKKTSIKKVSFKYKNAKQVKPILKKAFGAGGYYKHSQMHYYSNGQVFYNNMDGKKEYSISSSYVSSQGNPGAPPKSAFPSHYAKPPPYKDSMQNYMPQPRDSYDHINNHPNMRPHYDRPYFCVVDDPHYYDHQPNFERCNY